jgi:hypothetical protein
MLLIRWRSLAFGDSAECGFYLLVLTFKHYFIMQSSNKIVAIGTIIGLLSNALIALPALSGGIGDASSTSTIPTGGTLIQVASPIAVPASVNTPINSTISTSTAPIAAQYNQSGLQVNYSASSTLSPPSCNGGCVFAVTRASPTTTGSGANIEAMVGITMSLGTNDGGVSELNRLNGEMHKYTTENQVKLALSEKLAEALENGKMERATIIAMNLAPMLGYKDYRWLLRAVSNPNSTNPQMGTK